MFRHALSVMTALAIVSGVSFAAPGNKGGDYSEAQLTQVQTAKGVVRDALGPVIGAGVIVKGTTNGAVTDGDGNFSLPAVQKGTVLEISCIGYVTREVVWNGEPLDVVLEEDSEMIEETVVVGYGRQKKANVSGAVATVKMEEVLGDRPAPNIASALQGAVPGLTITSSSNTPGQTGKSIQIRGTATFSNSTSGTSGLGPLVLIDNVPGNMDALNPDDIESVTVLKDASASAIYGARAAAGVIIITTKRPKKAEKISINYSNNFGLVNATSTPRQERLDVYLPTFKEAFGAAHPAAGQNVDSWMEYLNLYNKDRNALASQGKLYEDTGIFVDGGGIRYYLKQEDIYERIMETGFSQNHNVSVSGATDRIRFRMSANSYNENGPLAGDKDKYGRKSFNGSISADITNWFTQEADFFYSQQQRHYLGSPNWLYSTRLQNFLPDGISPSGYIIRTPRAVLDNTNAQDTTIDLPRFFLKSILKPMKGLEAVFEYTYQKNSNQGTIFSNKWESEDWQQIHALNQEHDYYNVTRAATIRNAINAYATYKVDVAQDHHFSLMAGYSQESEEYEYYYTHAEDQAIPSIPSMSGAEGIITTSDSYYDYGIRSGFFRFNYDYAGKYILEVSGRYDGSSKFPKKSRFAFFPSFSVAWNATEEDFFSGSRRWLNQLKPRFSYGSIGNQNSAGYYDYIATMGFNTKATTWLAGTDEGYVTSLTAPGLVSAGFTWETITTMNVGLDFALFGNRLTGTFEYFQRDTKDILSASVQLPSILGTSAPNQNVGSLRTNGWELSVNWRGSFAQEKGRYNIGLNLWDYTSKITNINFNEGNSLDYLYIGKTVGEIWGYVWDGFYTVDDFEDLGTWKLKEGVVSVDGVSPRPGDYKYKNLRDNQARDEEVGVINAGNNSLDKPGDRKVIGNSTPRYQYGITLGAGYGGFDLSVMLQGVGKRDWMYTGELLYTFNSGDAKWYPVFEGTTNYWKPVSTDPEDPNYMVAANPNATLPRIYGEVGNGAYNRRNNTHMLSDASYLRIKNVTLSYTFPKKWLNQISVSNLRAFVSMENLATFSKLPRGIDPELLGWSYPLYRTTSFGLNLTF